jgi:ABC-type sugar transport system ATPase subunit
VSSLLEAVGVEKRYDGVYALQGVSFSVEAGEVHALMGENGAGKSTLSKIIAGVVRPDAGEIRLRGEPIALRGPLDAQKLGIGIIFQELDLFPNLTVGENLAIGNLKMERRRVVDFRELERFCRPFLEMVGLDCTINTLLEDLSMGQMQLVAIARALSLDARLLLMDEPTSSLGDDGVERLFQLIRSLTQRVVAVVYVSHKMQEIFAISDRVTVLRDGHYIGTRKTSETSVDEVISMMVGREFERSTRSASHASKQVLLSVRDLSTRSLSGISFDLHSGEVLGIAGLVGAGRSELGQALFGLDAWQSGSATLGGSDLHIRSPRSAISSGVGLVPEDRKLQGLMMQMSVRENSTMAVLPKLATGGVLRSREETAQADQVLRRTRLKAASLEAAVSSLSGGNQQKVLLARWLMSDPRVLFLDDPTRGIDVGAKHDIYGMIEDLAGQGKGILLVSSELPELLRCSDRILVLHEGRCTGVVDASTATQEHIMGMATGTA